MTDSPMTFDELTVDLNDLTIGEIETIEEITGLPIDRIGDPNAPKGKLLRALALVRMRRDDPTVTNEQVSQMKLVLGGGSPLANGHA